MGYQVLYDYMQSSGQPAWSITVREGSSNDKIAHVTWWGKASSTATLSQTYHPNPSRYDDRFIITQQQLKSWLTDYHMVIMVVLEI